MRKLLRPVPLVVLATTIALVGLLAYGVASQEPDEGVEDAIAKGRPVAAPTTSLPKLVGGGEGSVADYRGKVVVLNYWASWCKPCRTESPALERFHREIVAKGGTVLGVDVLDVASDARDFVKEFGLTYPMLRDADGSTQRELGVLAYPETFVVDKAGKITAVKRGPVDEAWLRRETEPLL
ncbi:MAG: TlpA family protein disulfide reductase [Thermoleophilaceae bacterium]|nr:TlpA family protein disulfide reductase [Thermoleophilaceae bacterium]